MTRIEEAVSALNGIGTAVVYGEPADFGLAEGVVLRETSRRGKQADGREYLTITELTLNIYAASCERAAELADAVETALAAAGFRRTARAEGKEGRLRRVVVKVESVRDALGGKWH